MLKRSAAGKRPLRWVRSRDIWFAYHPDYGTLVGSVGRDNAGFVIAATTDFENMRCVASYEAGVAYVDALWALED